MTLSKHHVTKIRICQLASIICFILYSYIEFYTSTKIEIMSQVASGMSPGTFTTPSSPLRWLITGCSSGLGLALARYAQSQGHYVITTSRSPSKTPELAAEIERDGKKHGRWVQLDVTDPDSGAVIKMLEEEDGLPIDVLVSNAAASVHTVVEAFTEDEVQKQMEVLYLGPFRLIRAAVPYMRRRRFGIMVNISTGAALEGRESMGTYASGKAATDAMIKVLAKEVAEFNIRTLTVHLGSFNTNMPTAAAPNHQRHAGWAICAARGQGQGGSPDI
ncbi:hypothetical protein LMH87_006003 [Akanthomyces muscarius]|uniref:Uncharacterized protein n=1 Tax=Akanthomyces muscarius TaxID=2231603 RepID=A0A9W8QLW1_AKAMU|nr:hypothetical protein LMH87_006003 [Akanthomyces muscarius]KAJ4164326.1 hypothetical protein LMH87_006003 [Akanthomyces muscarius]